MEWLVDIVLIIIIALVVGAAALYIYKEKKKGVKCIGCPYAKQCGGKCCGGGSVNAVFPYPTEAKQFEEATKEADEKAPNGSPEEYSEKSSESLSEGSSELK